MRQIMQIERRMQDIERKLENKQRQGKVTEVKFDQDKKRWYAKMEEGSGDETLKTDWMPWKSFSHGAIKFSVPPRVGQRVTLNSPNGELEQGVLEPFHYGPDDPSPTTSRTRSSSASRSRAPRTRRKSTRRSTSSRPATISRSRSENRARRSRRTRSRPKPRPRRRPQKSAPSARSETRSIRSTHRVFEPPTRPATWS